LIEQFAHPREIDGPRHHIPSLIPRVISHLFAGNDVRNPRIISTCINNEYAEWSGQRGAFSRGA
jgi:hypothetical protein